MADKKRASFFMDYVIRNPNEPISHKEYEYIFW